MDYQNNTKINSLTHEDLSDFLSTALYGSEFLSADYDADFYESIPEEQRNGNCFEDKLADVLLNDGTIYIYDTYAEGETYGENPKRYLTDDGEDAVYPITLKEIINGLEKCANGTYKGQGENKYLCECFHNLATDDYDQVDAENLMQIILFNELIYG